MREITIDELCCSLHWICLRRGTRSVSVGGSAAACRPHRDSSATDGRGARRLAWRE